MSSDLAQPRGPSRLSSTRRENWLAPRANWPTIFFIVTVLAWGLISIGGGSASAHLPFSSQTGLLSIQGLAAIAAGWLLWSERGGLHSRWFALGAAAVLAAAVSIALNDAAGATTVAGSYLWLVSARGSKARAAAAILLAMALQSYWAPLALDHFATPILQMDAALAGSLVALTVPGASWHGVVISTPGFEVEVRAGCSSFHNVALAALCWVALSRLERPRWRAADLAVVGLIVALQIVGNVARLYIVSLGPAMYAFWHEGMGKHFFAAACTAAAVFIAVAGTRWIDFRWPERAQPSTASPPRPTDA